jgi:hypothetical protein
VIRLFQRRAANQLCIATRTHALTTFVRKDPVLKDQNREAIAKESLNAVRICEVLR